MKRLACIIFALWVCLPLSAFADGVMTAASGSGSAAASGGAVTQSGTWTVQPGNTANTTAWKVDGSAVTQPVSGTITNSIGAGSVVRGTTGNVANAVTTNTTSTAVALPVGNKTIYGSVTGTGAVTQTQAIYGGITSGVTSTTGILLCTLTLSGTTTAVDACPVITANFLFYIMVSTATTGTGASGVVTAMY